MVALVAEAVSVVAEAVVVVLVVMEVNAVMLMEGRDSIASHRFSS